jgi:hypothetical protein
MGREIDTIPPETMSALISYQWPGNIRELQNLIERAVILSNDGVLPNPLPTAETERRAAISSGCNHATRLRTDSDSTDPGRSRLGDRRPERRSCQTWFETHYADPQDAEARDRPARSSKKRGYGGASTTGLRILQRRSQPFSPTLSHKTSSCQTVSADTFDGSQPGLQPRFQPKD